MFATNPDFPVQLTARDEADMVAYLKLLRYRLHGCWLMQRGATKRYAPLIVTLLSLACGNEPGFADHTDVTRGRLDRAGRLLCRRIRPAWCHS